MRLGGVYQRKSITDMFATCRNATEYWKLRGNALMNRATGSRTSLTIKKE